MILSDKEHSIICTHLKLKNLTIRLNSLWGSLQNDYRESIHSDLKEMQSKAYPLFDSSISHTQSLGGYAFSIFSQNDIHQIGFDVEISQRVTAKISQRIAANEAEFREAPSPASFWVAKEAAFKALKGPFQPKVVSEIQLTEWARTESHFETVRIKRIDTIPQKEVLGIVIEKSFLDISYHFSVFTAR